MTKLLLPRMLGKRTRDLNPPECRTLTHSCAQHKPVNWASRNTMRTAKRAFRSQRDPSYHAAFSIGDNETVAISFARSPSRLKTAPRRL